MPLETALGKSCEDDQEHPSGERDCLVDRDDNHEHRLPVPQLHAIGQATHLRCGEAAGPRPADVRPGNCGARPEQ